MGQTIVKKRHHRNRPIYFILIFLISITSCNGQENKNLRPKKVEASTTDSSSLATSWVDPLFFIEGQLCQHVRKIFQDRKGNIWFGTNVYGLMRYDGDSLEYFDKNNGHDYSRITGFAEDPAGNMWFSCYQGLIKYDGNSFTNFTEKDGLLNNEIWSFIIDSKGIFWIGTNDGISRFDGKTFTTFPLPKAPVKEPNTVYSADRITSIAEDKNSNLWFGTDGFGLCKYDGKTITHFTTEDGLPDNAIYELMADSKGNLWIGTFYGGVSKFDGEKFTNFTKDGLVEGVEVSGFFEEDNGDIWFAAENHGVYRFNASSAGKQGELFTHFFKEDGLQTNGILNIFKDKEGRFWFGGWGGLFRYVEKSFVSVTKSGPWSE